MTDLKFKSDGIVDFSGGMDSAANPSSIEKNQYTCAVNMRLKTGRSGIHTRQGFREVKLNFQTKILEEVYRTEAIQGSGYYLFGNEIVMLVSCGGRIFQLSEVNKREYDVTYIGHSNNPNNRNAYFTTVPDGIIINDGESKPIYGQKKTYRRAKENEIGAGHYGVYLQNRFCYVTQDKKRVRFATINNPMSLEESSLNNLDGYLVPDNTYFSAIGSQRFIKTDAQGGSLVLSSINNIYSIDIRGPMSTWKEITGDIYDVGAVSPYSFLSVNGNVYFRGRNLGLTSLQYLQSTFSSYGVVEDQSYGGKAFFDNDEPEFLNSCNSVKYNNRIFTTIAPSLGKNNSVYWNGFISAIPKQQGTITYESIYTGVRPWSLCQVDDYYGKEFLYIHSHDCDGVNRMYMLDEDDDFDRPLGKPVKEIESKIFTRSYSFDSGFVLKKSDQQIYSLSFINRNVEVEMSSRKSSDESFKTIFKTKHLQSTESLEKDGTFINATKQKGFRPFVPFPDNQESFLFKQDLMKIKGSCCLESIVRQASLHPVEKRTHTEEKISQNEDSCLESVFDYSIVS